MPENSASRSGAVGKLGTSPGMGVVGEKGDPARIQGGLGETSCCGGGEDPGRVQGRWLHWSVRVWLSVAVQSVCGRINTYRRIGSGWGIGSLVEKFEKVDGV